MSLVAGSARLTGVPAAVCTVEEARFACPTGLLVGPVSGRIFVLDNNNHCLRIISGRSVTRLTVPPFDANGPLRAPAEAAVGGAAAYFRTYEMRYPRFACFDTTYSDPEAALFVSAQEALFHIELPVRTCSPTHA